MLVLVRVLLLVLLRQVVQRLVHQRLEELELPLHRLLVVELQHRLLVRPQEHQRERRPVVVPLPLARRHPPEERLLRLVEVRHLRPLELVLHLPRVVHLR